MSHRDKTKHGNQDARDAAAIARAIREHAETNRPRPGDELDKRDQKNRRIQIWVAVIAAIYSGLTLLIFLKTSESIAVTQKHNAITERAWITSTGIPDFRDTSEAGQTPQITHTFINTGHTPAIDVHDISVIYLHEGRLDKGVVDTETAGILDRWKEEANKLSFVIGPNAKHERVEAWRENVRPGPVQTIRKLTPEEAAKVRDGKIQVMVFGQIEYRDIFSCRHITRFCYFASGNDGFGQPQKQLCPSGNDIDDATVCLK